MIETTIPAYLPEPTKEHISQIENLLAKFGNARRRAYSMKNKKGMNKSEISPILQEETGLNRRYCDDAYNSIKDLPSTGVTFGGKKNQELREKREISKEEFHRRRNCVLISRGDKSNNGNVNLRIVDGEQGLQLRINIGNHEWIYLELHIPQKYLEKYGHLLDGSKPYQVTITRKDGYLEDYEVKITVHSKEELEERDKLMALDINDGGHIDWAVVDKKDRELVETGRINCYKIPDSSTEKAEYLLHEKVEKIGNIAEHYGAEVVAGNRNTGNFSSPNSKANRIVKSFPQYKLRQILRYKLPLRGIPYKDRSESYTSVLGQYLCKPLGLDIHKGSAYAFAVKLLDYRGFETLRGVLADDGNGSQGEELSGGYGLTAFIKSYASGNGNLTGLLTMSLRNLFSGEVTPRLLGTGGPPSRVQSTDSTSEV